MGLYVPPAQYDTLHAPVLQLKPNNIVLYSLQFRHQSLQHDDMEGVTWSGTNEAGAV